MKCNQVSLIQVRVIATEIIKKKYYMAKLIFCFISIPRPHVHRRPSSASQVQRQTEARHVICCLLINRHEQAHGEAALTDRPSKTSCRSSGGCDTCRSSAAAGVQRLLHTASRQAGTRVHLCVLVHESIHPAQPTHAPKNCCREAAQAWRSLFWRRCEEKSETVFSVICHLEGRLIRVCGGKRLKDSGSFTPGAAAARHHLSSCVNKQSNTFPGAGPPRPAPHIILSSLSLFSSSSNH